jgi:hypothetical protein
MRARVMPLGHEAKAAKPIRHRTLQSTSPVEVTKDRPAGSLCLLLCKVGRVRSTLPTLYFAESQNCVGFASLSTTLQRKKKKK